MERTRTGQIAGWIERGLVVVGVACLVWVGATSMQAVGYQLRQSAQLDQSGPSRTAPGVDRTPAVDAPLATGAAIGRLKIPRLGLSVVVAAGDDEKTLRVAAGHLPDTPLPWQDGNSAVAAHRDSFFRPLRRIRTGDYIRLETARGVFEYRVTRQMIVEPDDLWVLDPSPTAALTLITCYPFDFVGSAPRRFVVQAQRLSDPRDTTHTTVARRRDLPHRRPRVAVGRLVGAGAARQRFARRRRARLARRCQSVPSSLQ